MDKKLFCIRDVYADYTRYIWLSREDFHDEVFFDDGGIFFNDRIYSDYNRVSRILTKDALNKYYIDCCLYIDYIPDSVIKDIIKGKEEFIKTLREDIKKIKNDIKILKGKEV